MALNPAIIIDEKALADFCRQWRIRELSVFGSAIREDFNPESDIDFLVSFEPDSAWSLLDLVTMRDQLSSLTDREVDLVEKEGLRNPFRRAEILSTREVIHAS